MSNHTFRIRESRLARQRQAFVRVVDAQRGEKLGNDVELPAAGDS